MGRISTATRRNAILQMIIENGTVINSELARQFGVTTETIRKDIIYLENERLLEKQHGKATKLYSVKDSPVTLRSVFMTENKNRIARKATEFIKNGDVIYMDGGSTVLELANLLDKFEDLTVITNSISVANVVLKQKNNIYLIGGFIDNTTQITNGPSSIDSLKNFRPSISFMGTNGIKLHAGPTTNDFNNIDLKKAVLEVCAINCILCDSSKFEKGAVTQYATWDQCRYLISDAPLPEELRSKMPNTLFVNA